METPGGFECFATSLAEEEGPRVRELLDRLPFDVTDFGDDHMTWFCPRAVALPALTVPENTLVLVDGDLRVEGLLDDRPLHADPDNVRGFVVAGDLEAGTLLLGSETHVAGSVRVRDWLVAESDGDYRLTVEGALTAKRIIALGHHFKIAKATTAEWKIGYLGLASDVPKTEMAKAFVPEVVNAYGGIDIRAVAARILEGQPVTR